MDHIKSQIYDPEHVFSATQKAVVSQAINQAERASPEYPNQGKSKIFVFFDEKESTSPLFEDMQYHFANSELGKKVLSEVDIDDWTPGLAVIEDDLHANRITYHQSYNHDIDWKGSLYDPEFDNYNKLVDERVSQKMNELHRKDLVPDLVFDIKNAPKFVKYAEKEVTSEIIRISTANAVRGFLFNPISIVVVSVIAILIFAWNAKVIIDSICDMLFLIYRCFKFKTTKKEIVVSDRQIETEIELHIDQVGNALFDNNSGGIGFPVKTNLKQEEEMVNFSSEILMIREFYLEKNKQENFIKIWKEVLLKLRSISSRAELYMQYKTNASNKDAKEAKEKISIDITKLFKDVHSLRISLMPKMDESIKAKIMGEELIDSTINILANERLIAIEENIKLAEETLPITMKNEAYTIAEMRKTYLPDTVAAYIKAKTHSKEEAESLFSEQLHILETGVEKTIEAIRQENIEMLQINGAFLKERFQQPQN